MDGDLPFLKDDAFKDEPAPEPVAEVQPEPVAEPVEAKGEPEQAAPPAAVEEAKHIPITALLDERDKRKAKEREAEELRRRLAEYEAKAQPKPDFFADPEAALSAAQQAAMAAALNTKLETSRFLAEKEYGADLVAKAYAFFDDNPHLSLDLIKSPSPFHAAVQTYQRHKMLEEIGDDPASYRARIEAEVKERLAAEMQAQPKPTAPPPSMAAAAGVNGGNQAPSSPFDALFVKG